MKDKDTVFFDPKGEGVSQNEPADLLNISKMKIHNIESEKVKTILGHFSCYTIIQKYLRTILGVADGTTWRRK